MGHGTVPVTAPVRPPVDTATLREMREMARGWQEYVHGLHALPHGEQLRLAQYVRACWIKSRPIWSARMAKVAISSHAVPHRSVRPGFVLSWHRGCDALA